jgi:hypothetical protein
MWMVYFLHNEKFDAQNKIMLITKSKRSKHKWCAPKFLVRPKEGPTMLKCKSSWNLVSLPTSSIKGGERGMLKTPGLD